MATRPVFHKTDAGIRGHVFCTFLALVLRKDLMDRLAARKTKLLEWQRNVARNRPLTSAARRGAHSAAVGRSG